MGIALGCKNVGDMCKLSAEGHVDYQWWDM